MAPIAERRASSAHLRRQRELTRTERARAATSMRCFATSMLSPRNAEGGPAAGMEQAQSCATARARGTVSRFLAFRLLHSLRHHHLGGTDGFERRGVASGDELVIDVRVSPASSTREPQCLKPLSRVKKPVNLLGVHVGGLRPQTHSIHTAYLRLQDELAFRRASCDFAVCAALAGKVAPHHGGRRGDGAHPQHPESRCHECHHAHNDIVHPLFERGKRWIYLSLPGSQRRGRASLPLQLGADRLR